MCAPSPGSSCNQPMKNLASVFSDETVVYDLSISSSERQISESPEPSCVSVKSNASMMEPLKFSDGPGTSNPPISSSERQISESPEPSCVSVKSNTSMMEPIKFSDGPGTSNPFISSSERQISESPEPSCVSVKSNTSMMEPIKFSDGPGSSNPSGEIYDLNKSLPYSASHYQHHIRMNKNVSYLLTHKKTINKTHSLLEETEALIQDSHQSVDDVLQRFKYQHKTTMKNKHERLSEGNKQENVTLLNRIYTQLYIIKGESEGVNEEHEVLQMDKTSRTQHSQDTSIYCSDIFKASPEPESEEKEQIKTVLTKGIAGIGKTVSVQKFILDWAEGKANQDVDFMFVLSFRELNLIRDHQYSLHRLLLDFHPELQDLDSQIYEECKVVFIFDGLDESRITLMFSDAQKVCDVTETSSVAVLMTKLMKGELLPSALI